MKLLAYYNHCENVNEHQRIPSYKYFNFNIVNS